jgi:hypothetical protein
MKKTITLLAILFCLHINSQNIMTIAGNGSGSYSGDGGAAITANINLPYAVAFDAAGNMYIADVNNFRIRKVNKVTGIISTFAGNGISGYSGDGGQATNAKLNYPSSVAFDAADNMYIADNFNHCIRKVNTSGIISTFAGSGIAGYSGDGGTATSAKLNYPEGLTIDNSGTVYVADAANNRIREINISTGIIKTTAGNGTAGFNGDGVASTTELSFPIGVSFDANTGYLYIADRDNNRVRLCNGGVVNTVAGNGGAGFSGDGGQATGFGSELWYPSGVVRDAAGNVYIADNGNHRIRKINTAGVLSTFAGNGTASFSGDGGAATAAELTNPEGVAIDTQGNLYISDSGNNRVRFICNSGINITVNSPGICAVAGATATLTASGANTYTWNTGATGSAITVSPTSSANYIVTGTSANNCANPTTSTVTVHSLPGIAVNTAIICAGNQTTLVATITNTVLTTCAWSNGTTGIYNVVSPTVTTNYTTTATDANNCKNTATTIVIVNPLPTVSVISNTTNLCTDSTAILTANGANTYTWSTSATTTTIAITPSVTTTYTVTGKDGNGCINAITLTQTVTNCSASGIDKITNNNEVNIYPNPNTGTFIIETNTSEKQTLKIFDINGKLVLSQFINDKTNIDASGLNAGVYNISILGNAGIIYKRMVIVK